MADADDTSPVSSTDEAAANTAQEVSKALVTPAIELSFGSGNGGAWDDRELIHAYDAAMEEFHVSTRTHRVAPVHRGDSIADAAQAHHPGPGSWLDKMTASLAKGQPLPSVKAKDSA